jgi:hypothetical protein
MRSPSRGSLVGASPVIEQAAYQAGEWDGGRAAPAIGNTVPPKQTNKVLCQYGDFRNAKF